DHMSAMQVIDRVKAEGGEILSFQSSTGGLVAPKYDNNPWNYKFTWNPRNVVLAGHGVSTFIKNGKYKYIPYHKLFKRILRTEVLDYGEFEIYPNRDSLKYREIYGLDNIPSMFRGTMRRPGYSRSWNIFVQLGMTDDSYSIGNSEKMTYREFTNSFLAYHPTDSVELKLRHYLKIDQDDIIWSKLMELNLFDDTKTIQLKNATPAQILQKILTDSWTLNPDDKDMIVMHHKFGYELDGKKEQIESQMVLLGKDQIYTAMAQTVGLPVAIATLLILNKKITSKGVLIPIKKEIYMPILNELENYGILFKEKKSPLF
ncbi:MAG: saccharopine dehydrogenase, partial [Flavobacteriaceae bacterium]|nr:saccharopine dehydrogenase [Flavobacteriaceae bacterium]